MFNSDHSLSIDHCGQVDTISEHAAMLIPLYFFPLIILSVIITRKIILNVKHVVEYHVGKCRFETVYRQFLYVTTANLSFPY